MFAVPNIPIKWLLIVFCGFFLWSRLVHLPITLPFSFDEATDLVYMKRIYDDRKITLIGPISTDNKKVFSSLTYYMYLPFAAVGDFSLISPTYGAVFWGLITSIILLLIVSRHNPRLLLLAATMLLVWHPLLITQRHAYNPNLVFLWLALAVWLAHTQSRFRLFLAGLAVGLSLHHHYLSAIAGICWILVTSVRIRRVGGAKGIAIIWLGFLTALAPFLLFDLTHLPGVFILRYISNSYAPEVGFSAVRLLPAWWAGIHQSLGVIGGPFWLAAAIGLVSVVLWVRDMMQRATAWFWLLPFLAQTGAGMVLTIDFAPRYIYPGLVFYFVWLFQPRKSINRLLQLSLIGMIVVGSAVRLPAAISQPTTYPPVIVVESVVNHIKDAIGTSAPPNPNIAAIASPDGQQLGLKYRWLLGMHGIHFKAASEYDQSETLFVVSTDSETVIRSDPSVPAVLFRDAQLVNVTEMPLYPWRLYQFSFD